MIRINRLQVKEITFLKTDNTAIESHGYSRQWFDKNVAPTLQICLVLGVFSLKPVYDQFLESPPLMRGVKIS